jgi:FixJ family two-component response regulator
MPGMNGRELAEKALLRQPALKVLFMTGYSRNAIVHQGRLDPGVELIQKPLTAEQLGSKVRQVLDHLP